MEEGGILVKLIDFDFGSKGKVSVGSTYKGPYEDLHFSGVKKNIRRVGFAPFKKWKILLELDR